MKSSVKRPAIVLAALLVCAFACMFFANLIQTDGGRVYVELGALKTPEGTLTYKLYRPETATAETPAPGVLLLHGYQNDHETSGAYAIELARRGAVVLALDEYGHGATSVGMAARGYTDHRVTVIFGEDSEAEGTFVAANGPVRYRVMTNFSNMSFFNERYSKGSDGSAITDSSMGGVAAYAALASMEFVDATRLGVSGHSMGTWSSWSTAAAYAGATDETGADIAPKAVVLQCGELFRESAYSEHSDIYFNNVLLLQAKYDEFNYFRDYKNIVSDELLRSEVRTEFLGCTADEAAWNTTYGDFADGSARRMELLYTNHRLTTHDANGLAAAMAWFGEALALDTALAPDQQTAMVKEWLVFAALLLSIAAMPALAEVLLCTRFFAPVRQPLPDRPERVKTGRKWWGGALTTMLVAGLTYPFMTQLGHGLLPLPEGVFRMTIGNGFLAWYLLLILVALATTLLPWRKAKKQGAPMDYVDLGLGANDRPARMGWALCGKSALLALCMLALLYAVTAVCEALFLLDLRFIWPFFKTFTGARALQFLVYLPVFALFFLLNNSKIFAQMRVQGTEKPGLAGFLRCWWKYALCMVGGVLLLILLEYIPFFLDIGPGVDLLFTPTFGGPFMSLMIVFTPQVLVFSVLCTYFYRRTGSVYTGAFTVAAMAAWIVTGGSAML